MSVYSPAVVAPQATSSTFLAGGSLALTHPNGKVGGAGAKPVINVLFSNLTQAKPSGAAVQACRKLLGGAKPAPKLAAEFEDFVLQAPASQVAAVATKTLLG